MKNMEAVGTYFRRIAESAKSVVVGMGITWRYLVRPKEVVTIEYGSKRRAPKERYIPDRHRGIHYLETDKCIHCHICEKACPVDCIEMDGSREPFEGAWVGDGCYMSKFILDLNKCIFCNLCCEPCPKECIHMGQEFDVAGYTRSNGVKNLLTDRPWSPDDRVREAHARNAIEEVEAEAKRRKAEAKKKKSAQAKGKAAAGKKEGAGSGGGAAPEQSEGAAAKPAEDAPAAGTEPEGSAQHPESRPSQPEPETHGQKEPEGVPPEARGQDEGGDRGSPGGDEGDGGTPRDGA